MCYKYLLFYIIILYAGCPYIHDPILRLSLDESIIERVQIVCVWHPAIIYVLTAWFVDAEQYLKVCGALVIIHTIIYIHELMYLWKFIKKKKLHYIQLNKQDNF